MYKNKGLSLRRGIHTPNQQPLRQISTNKNTGQHPDMAAYITKRFTRAHMIDTIKIRVQVHIH